MAATVVPFTGCRPPTFATSIFRISTVLVVKMSHIRNTVYFYLYSVLQSKQFLKCKKYGRGNSILRSTVARGWWFFFFLRRRVIQTIRLDNRKKKKKKRVPLMNSIVARYKCSCNGICISCTVYTTAIGLKNLYSFRPWLTLTEGASPERPFQKNTNWIYIYTRTGIILCVCIKVYYYFFFIHFICLRSDLSLRVFFFCLYTYTLPGPRRGARIPAEAAAAAASRPRGRRTESNL